MAIAQPRAVDYELLIHIGVEVFILEAIFGHVEFHASEDNWVVLQDASLVPWNLVLLQMKQTQARFTEKWLNANLVELEELVFVTKDRRRRP